MKLILALLLCLLSPALAHATNYYVSNAATNGYVVGNNSNNCTAKATPCLTVSGGVGKMSANNGDTLTINSGTYTDQLNNTIPTGSSESVRTTVQCEVRRTCAITSSSIWVIRLVDSTKQYITITGLVLKGTAGTSVPVAFNSTTTPPSSNYPHHINFIDNEVGPSNVYCLYTGHGASNKFNYNWIHTCDEQGVYNTAVSSEFIGNEFSDMKYGQQGMTVHSSGGNAAQNNLIERNVFHDNVATGGFSGTNVGTPRAIEMGGTGQSGNIIRRNVCYNMPASCFRASTNVGPIVNFKLEQNTCYNSAGCIDITHTSSTGNTSSNNIALAQTATAFTLCGGCGTATDNRTAGTASDIFTDLGSNNFTLKAGSAAINDGTDIGLAYNGAAPDHGAFETFVIASAEVGLVDATSLIMTFTNNVGPPLLPSSGITGFTVTENASPITVSSCARTGDNIIDCTLGSSIVSGRTVLVSYSGGNVTDSALIGNTWNQPLHTITDQAVTNNVGGGSSAVLTQTYYRFHHLLGTEAAPVVLPGTASAVNTPITLNPGGKVRLRLKVACTAADCDPIGMFLRYSLNSGGYSTVVPDAFGADNIRFVGTSTISGLPDNTTATTEQLTSDHASMVACALVRTSNAIPSIDLSQNSETECEYVVEVDSDASEGDTYDFRLYSQTGTALSAYTVTPRITVQKVASGGR